MNAVLLYVTFGNRDEALNAARTVIEERLAPCANLLPAARSLYRWRGELHEKEEFVLVLKTSQARAKALLARLADLHSYDCPGIVVLPILDGHPDYLKWIVAETS